MILVNGVSLIGLQPVMRRVLGEAEKLWVEYGHIEGVTITKALGGIHSAASWHYYGYALDLRINYLDKGLPGPDIQSKNMVTRLEKVLNNGLYKRFDIIIHKTHIHIEISDSLAKNLKVMF